MADNDVRTVRAEAELGVASYRCVGIARPAGEQIEADHMPFGGGTQPISGETRRWLLHFGHLLHAFLCASFIVYRFEFNVFILYSFVRFILQREAEAKTERE